MNVLFHALTFVFLMLLPLQITTTQRPKESVQMITTSKCSTINVSYDELPQFPVSFPNMLLYRCKLLGKQGRLVKQVRM